jgi:hypothetical protein
MIVICHNLTLGNKPCQLQIRTMRSYAEIIGLLLSFQAFAVSGRITAVRGWLGVLPIAWSGAAGWRGGQVSK